MGAVCAVTPILQQSQRYTHVPALSEIYTLNLTITNEFVMPCVA